MLDLVIPCTATTAFLTYSGCGTVFPEYVCARSPQLTQPAAARACLCRQMLGTATLKAVVPSALLGCFCSLQLVVASCGAHRSGAVSCVPGMQSCH